MEKIEFNTGRKYTTEGQPITAVRIGSKIWFRDDARFIVGSFEIEAGEDLTQRTVMKYYDAGKYSCAGGLPIEAEG